MIVGLARECLIAWLIPRLLRWDPEGKNPTSWWRQHYYLVIHPNVWAALARDSQHSLIVTFDEGGISVMGIEVRVWSEVPTWTLIEKEVILGLR